MTKVILYGCDVEVYHEIWEKAPGFLVGAQPGNGWIEIDGRIWKERDVEKAIHYLLSL